MLIRVQVPASQKTKWETSMYEYSDGSVPVTTYVKMPDFYHFSNINSYYYLPEFKFQTGIGEFFGSVCQTQHVLELNVDECF